MSTSFVINFRITKGVPRSSYSSTPILPFRAITGFYIVFDITSPGQSNIYQNITTHPITLYHYGDYDESFFQPYQTSYTTQRLNAKNILVEGNTYYLSKEEYENIASRSNIIIHKLDSSIHHINEDFRFSYYTKLKLLKRRNLSQAVVDEAVRNNSPSCFFILFEMPGSILDPHEATESIYVLLYYTEEPKQVKQAFFSKAYVFNINWPLEADIIPV